MQKYKCTVCGYVYDPAKATPWAISLPALSSKPPNSWSCPHCGAFKTSFEPEG